MMQNRHLQTLNRSSTFRYLVTPVRSNVKRISLVQVLCVLILVISVALFGIGILQQGSDNHVTDDVVRIAKTQRFHPKIVVPHLDTVSHLRKDVILLAQRQGVRQSYSHRVRSLMYRRSLVVFKQAVPMNCVCPNDNTTTTNSTTQPCDCDDIMESNSTTAMPTTMPTTVPEVTTPVTTPVIRPTTPPPVVTTPVVTLETTTVVATPDPPTVVIPVTPDDRSGLIAIEIFGATIGGMVGLCFCCYYCIIFLFVLRRRKLKKQKYDVETEVTPKMLGIGVGVDTIEIEAWRWALLKEDMIRDGIAKGSCSVLEFAIQEARSSELYSADAALIAEAEEKLNEWRRAQNLLKDALDSKDLAAIQDYMSRFEDLDIKDETGIYDKCLSLMTNRTKLKDEMKEAAETRNERKLIDSMAKFKNLNLAAEDTNNDPDLIAANQILNEITQNRALEGKTHDDIRNQLREAVDQRKVGLIGASIAKFEAALIPDVYGDLEKAKRTLNEIEAERLKHKDATFQAIMDASQKRDTKALSVALQDGARYGVDMDDLREGEKLLKLLEREDQLLHQMRELIAERDSGRLLEAIAIFRTPGLQLVDKTGDVAKADDLLQELREKERLHRAKGDAMWRLQQARNVGDVVVMDGMIKALDNLASAGEEVDEAMLIRAKTELETLRGRVDYRKRMETIKSAITRMANAENIPQLADLIEQMVELSAEETFTMTADDTRVLDESRVMLHDLRRKHAIKDDIDVTRPLLQLPLVPDSLKDLTKGVDKMMDLKNIAAEFPGVFTDSDNELLTKATEDLEDLKVKVSIMTAARDKLETAMKNRDFVQLIDAIADAELAPFIDPEEVEKAKNLSDFLDPIIRVSALRKAIKSRNIENLSQSLEDFKNANVQDEEVLFEKGQRTLKKLIKLEKKQRKADRKRKREEERRRAEIEALNQRLQRAIDAHDIEALQDALDACENSGYRDDEIPLYPRAEEIYDEMTVARLRARLEEGIQRRDISILEDTIDEADYGGYVADLGIDYQRAKDLLYHLRELHKLRDAVAGMDRSLISEVRNYPTPPKSVHVVMTATMLLLGEPKENIKSWHSLQILIGKMGEGSLNRRVRQRAPGDIPRDLGNQVEAMLEGFDITSVESLSRCAGAFFAWIKCMIKESRFLLNADMENVEIASAGSSISETTAM